MTTAKKREVSKGVLKAKMLAFFRDIERTGEELIVTDRGKPVLRIAPFAARENVDSLFADLRPHARLKEAAILANSEDEWPPIST